MPHAVVGRLLRQQLQLQHTPVDCCVVVVGFDDSLFDDMRMVHLLRNLQPPNSQGLGLKTSVMHPLVDMLRIQLQQFAELVSFSYVLEFERQELVVFLVLSHVTKGLH